MTSILYFMLKLNTKYCTIIASQLLYIYDNNFFQFEANYLASSADHSALMQPSLYAVLGNHFKKRGIS
jgi:hypothetical protein